MKQGSVLATVALLGYFAFEISNVYRLRYRTEPLFILQEYTQADEATTQCGAARPEERERFLRNFAVIERKALKDLSEQSADNTAADAALELDNLKQERRQHVSEWIKEKGCKDKTVWRWVKLHEVRARLNLR